MVLQAKTFGKRADSENAVPIKDGTLASQNFRASFHAAATRRRARTSGTKTAKYAVEQAKRRSMIRSPVNLIRVPFPVYPRSPSPQVVDVEMGDATPPPPTPPATVSLNFPLYLGRPEYVEVPKASIEVIDPDLANADPSYIRDTLTANTMGPRCVLDYITYIHSTYVTSYSMYQVLRRYSPKDKDLLSRGTLPREITIIIEDMTSVAPTHMLAVHGPRPKDAPEGAKTQVTLFPIHSLILAVHCANLPPFPAPINHFSTEENPTSREVVLPVRPLFLFSPRTLPFLLEYLYLKRTDALLRHIIPVILPATLIDEPDQYESFARVLGTKFSAVGLLQQITIVHGLWQNACALGVYDDDLWSVIDFAWKLLLMSLAVCTGKSETLESIKAAVTVLEDEHGPSESSALGGQESASPNDSP